jgi:hypothetical protein
MAALVHRGLVANDPGGTGGMVATQLGLDVVGIQVAAPRTPAEVLAMWAERLPKQAAAMLTELARHDHLTHEALAEALGYSLTSSSWANSVRTLVRANLVGEDQGGYLYAMPELRVAA